MEHKLQEARRDWERLREELAESHDARAETERAHALEIEGLRVAKESLDAELMATQAQLVKAKVVRIVLHFSLCQC